MNSSQYFDGFEHPASAISSYLYTIDTYIISLKSGEIARFVCPDPQEFQQWLDAHNVPHIQKQVERFTQMYYSKTGKQRN